MKTQRHNFEPQTKVKLVEVFVLVGQNSFVENTLKCLHLTILNESEKYAFSQPT